MKISARTLLVALTAAAADVRNEPTAALVDIEVQFGSVEGYALNALALAPSTLEQLRDRLLEAS